MAASLSLSGWRKVLRTRGELCGDAGGASVWASLNGGPHEMDGGGRGCINEG